MSGSLFAQQEHIEWKYDVDSAIKVAAEQEKLVLLHFSASWCAPCKEIERFVFVNPMAIRAIGGQVIPVKIDVDLHPQIAEEFSVQGVPYDVIITPARHVVSQRPSPRSSDGYLQMIQQSQLAASNLSDRVVGEVAELKQEIARQRTALAKTADAKDSFGMLAVADSNQFQSEYKAPEGVDVPKFENPRPWSAPQIESRSPSSDGVIANQFVIPSSDFRPEMMKVTSPAETGSFASNPQNMKNQFQSKSQFANSDPSFGTSKISIHHFGPASTSADSSSSIPGDSGFSGRTALSDPKALTHQAAQPLRIMNPMAQKQPAKIVEQPEIPVTMESLAAVSKLGLEGYCGVTLMEDHKWVKGNVQWGCHHRGRLYLFASKEHLDRFQMSPDMFSPLLGGSDPVDFHLGGKLVSGQRKHGVFYGEDSGPTVIVLFANPENRARFESDPSEYLRTVRQAMSRVDGDLLLR